VVLDIHKEVKIEYKLVTTEEADVEKGMISTTFAYWQSFAESQGR